MRVNVQLIDAETGAHLWAERFDEVVPDLFDMQDKIVARLARQLDTQLVAAEARRAEQAPRPDSMDLYFQGRAYWNRGLTTEYVTKASGFYERALARDPKNVPALVRAAAVNLVYATQFLANDGDARLAAAEAFLTKALSLAPENAGVHLALGAVQLYTNRAAQGIAEFERALALDRNLASAHALLGHAKYFLGRAEETEAHVNEALRLSPRDSMAYVWLEIAGYAKFLVGRDEEAVALLRRSIETNPNSPWVHFQLAAALAHLGRLAEASKLGLRSIRPLQSRAALLPRRAITRLIWLSLNALLKACARRACRRDERFQAARSSSKAFASFRSRVSNPSVNQP